MPLPSYRDACEADELHSPIGVELEVIPCKTAHAGQRIKTVTTMELACRMAAVWPKWRIARLRYIIPAGETLIISLIEGIEGEYADVKRIAAASVTRGCARDRGLVQHGQGQGQGQGQRQRQG